MQVELHVTEGPVKGRHFSFDTPDCFLMGRAADAHISLPDDPYLSRQHFLLLISPPQCILTDLGSKNGVSVNGVRYGGQRPPSKKSKQAPSERREVALKDGDCITVGNTHIQVSIHTDNLPDDQSEIAPSSSEEALPQFLTTKGFQNIHKLFQGSKGPIYRAIEPEKGLDVVIKALQFPEDSDPQKIRRLQVELELLSHLRHRHIVSLIKYGACGQCVFCVMDYVDGVDLAQFLQPYGNGMPLPEAAFIMLGLLDGLAYAHTRKIMARASRGASTSFRGLVHRDLKMQNIFLAPEGDVLIPKLTDFGLSRGFEIAGLTNISNPTEIGDAPLYWPREQITHYARPSLMTDVFALAALFYQMLTGDWIREGFHDLFAACEKNGTQPSLTDYARIILKNPPVPIRQRRPDIPEPLAYVLDRALREEELSHDTASMQGRLSEMRYPHARAFYEAIVRAFQEIEMTPLPLTAASLSVPQQSQPSQPDIDSDSETPLAGTIVYSMLKASSKYEAALFVLNVVQTVSHTSKTGDTRFRNLIGPIFKCIKNHPSASDLTFLKCTGNGFLGTFYSMRAALSTALSFITNPILPDTYVRIALHWGTVKTNTHSDVLGTDVQKVYCIEEVKANDLVEPILSEDAFPLENRILISKQGMAQLPRSAQGQFTLAGKFRLQGFHELHDLWIYSV